MLEIGQLDGSFTDLFKSPTKQTTTTPGRLSQQFKMNSSQKDAFVLELSDGSLQELDNDGHSSFRERETKEKLGSLLDQYVDDELERRPTKIIPFTSVRERYVKAVSKLKPVDMSEILKNLPDSDRKWKKKEVLQEAVETQQKYGHLKGAWDKYEYSARDRPREPSEEEREMQRRIDSVEDSVDNAWQSFANDVVRTAKTDGTDGDDLAYWSSAAKRQKEEAEARRKAKLLHREKEENQYWREEGMKLRAATEKDKETKAALGEILDQCDYEDPSERARGPTKLLPFTAVRKRYLAAIAKYRPSSIEDELRGIKDKKVYWQKRKEILKREDEKKKQYEMLKYTWDEYLLAALDKPEEPTKEDIEINEEIDKIENEVDNAWQEVADSTVEKAKADGLKAEEDDDLAYWAAEARRLKEEADARRRARELRRKQEEDAFWKSEGKKLRDAAREGSGVANPYDDGEDEDETANDDTTRRDDDDPTESSIPESPSKSPKKKAGGDSDSDSSGSESEAGSSKKKKKKKKDKKKDKKKKSKHQAEEPKTPKTQKKDVVLKEDQAPSTPRNDDGSLWKNPLTRWTNKPKKKIREDGAKIIFKVPPKTDCWRKTRHNFIMDNAPYNWHKVSGDFEVEVHVSGSFGAIYDRAGIMVRLDEENWILAGMEYFNDRLHASVIVTRDYSDWSLAALPENIGDIGLWIALKRMGNSYETFYSFDKKKWVQTRQGLFSDRPVLSVGICGCSPMGDDDLKVTFDHYRVKSL